ncbi:Rieske (2Fe-2S) protein [Micrococcus luteus]|nr:Rieske (2Fe-2S) protein [Micrococcus luteus]MCV7721953.1 Rieske (2Fe-2S) protein [Micrococcus luteus]MCV7740503.1 Rieske (2Fe-2S) protein [Micrococcus luteus]
MFDRFKDALIPGTKVNTADIPSRGGVALPHAPYVVTQPEPGVFCAFRKQCPHAGRPVDEVNHSGIRCSAHGSEFDLATGAPHNGPAQKPLRPANVRIDGKRIIITG